MRAGGYAIAKPRVRKVDDEWE